MMKEEPCLNGWARKAERHWREHLPKLVAGLEKKGELWETLAEAGEAAEELYVSLRKQKLDHLQAEEIALKEYILLDPAM